MAKKPNPDSDLRNSDWLKASTWDLPTSVDEFLAVIGGQDALDHFMKLPAAEAMPKDLRDALRAMEKIHG